MNIYLILQITNNGYDTYDSAVVVAESLEKARQTHPYVEHLFDDVRYKWYWKSFDGTVHYRNYGDWAEYKNVRAEFIGTTDREPGVICASFNAG